METKMYLVKNEINSKKPAPFAHPQFTKILFENQRRVKNVFQDISGHFFINYIGVSTIDPNGIWTSLSSNPVIEYNLFQQNLFAQDNIVLSLLKTDMEFKIWSSSPSDILQSKINKIKLLNIKYTDGVAIFHKVDEFSIIYSIGIHAPKINNIEYIIENIDGIRNIGHFFYKSLRDIFNEHANIYAAPKIEAFSKNRIDSTGKKHLKLVHSSVTKV